MRLCAVVSSASVYCGGDVADSRRSRTLGRVARRGAGVVVRARRSGAPRRPRPRTRTRTRRARSPHPLVAWGVPWRGAARYWQSDGAGKRAGMVRGRVLGEAAAGAPSAPRLNQRPMTTIPRRRRRCLLAKVGGILY